MSDIMSYLLIKIKILFKLLMSKDSIAGTLNKHTKGRIMDHYRMSDKELLDRLSK